MAQLVDSIPVRGPSDQHVRVLFYEDGSVRIRIHDAGPMALTEAFLTGAGKHVILKLEPKK